MSIKNISIFTNFLAFLLLSFGIQAQDDSTKVAITRFDKVNAEARVHHTYIDERNVIWVASSKGLIETTGDGSKYIEHFPNTEIIDVISDKKDNIWAASNSAIYNVKTKVSTSLPMLGLTISNICYHAGSIWVGTDKGIFVLNTTTGKYKGFDNTNSKLISNNINFIHSDRNGIIWVGTDKGYVRIDGEKWELQDKNDKMLATCENNEGQWIISSKDMFLINKFNRLFPVKLDSSQYKGKINNFVIDSKGRIYIASDILVRYDPYKEQIENYSEDAATLSKAALSLSCDKNDNIWIGTGGAGFFKLLFGDIAKEQLSATCLIEKNIQCKDAKDGVIKVSVSGGTRPFSYEWNKPNLSGNQINNLGEGTYEVTVTDKNKNTYISSVTLTSPEPIMIDLVANNRVVNPEKPDGSIEVKVSGGAGNYTYQWSNGQKTMNLTNVPSGSYSLNVKDKNGCMVTASYNVKREKFIPDLEISKITLGQKLRINELNFEADSSSITQANHDILDEVYEFLNSNPTVSVEIGGHTNTIPPHEYCDQLSLARAKRVAEFLYERGIDKSRVAFKGYGKREPLTDSTALQGRQKNQRVEIKILNM